MARSFNDAATEYLALDSAPATTMPLSMACWFRSDSVALEQRIMWLGDKDSDAHFYSLNARGATAGDPISFSYCAGGSTYRATSTTGYTANTWYHACGVATDAIHKYVYLNGGSKDYDANNATPANLDRICFAKFGGSTAGNYLSGMVAEAAIWTVALSDADVLMLSKGVSPLLVQGASLVAYWPFLRGDNDWVGGYNLTAYNTPSFDAHPMQIIPVMWQMNLPFAITGAAGGQPARAMNLYRRRWGI